MSIQSLIFSARDQIIEHSPEILTGLGIAGMASAIVLAVKATPRAIDTLAEVKEAHKEDEDKKELAKDIVVKVAPKYIPAMAAFAFSTTCLISSVTVNNRRTAALATAYSLSETALIEYKDKVKAVFGEDKEKEVTKAIAQDKIDRNPPPRAEVRLPAGDDVLCYDSFGERYFYSNANKLEHAENMFNKQLINGCCPYASLTELYYEFELNGVKDSNDRYFNTDHLVDLEFSSTLTEDNRPCLVIGFWDPPKLEYGRIR